MVIVRCWLEQLFNCAFESAVFQNIIFNPEMLNLLFDNEQFHVQKIAIGTSNITLGNFVNFGLNRFAISDIFALGDPDISEQHTDILFNIIKNEGKKLPQTSLGIFNKFSRLYNLVIEYITTSKDISKMVPSIGLVYESLENCKLPKKAKIIKTNGDFTKYEIVNIYNPKLKFLVWFDKLRTVFYVNIKKMEE
ncbi:unnamed protein product [Meloidogyne enterolobii]|uniref:Uncharacterized protein n=1 Tax=Meloidogyne enterolobii TaxID=390850 RepID=A0ACB1ABX8_MELEN